MNTDFRDINSPPNAVLPLRSPCSLVHPPPALTVPVPPLHPKNILKNIKLEERKAQITDLLKDNSFLPNSALTH